MEEYENLQTELAQLNNFLLEYTIASALNTIIIMVFISAIMNNFSADVLLTYVVLLTLEAIPLWNFACFHFVVGKEE